MEQYRKIRILILCTGNSCRSQMAEGFLKSFDQNLEVYSAGTRPAPYINSYAIDVMREIGIDISKQYPKSVDEYIDEYFDYLITVCDNAKENCPVFKGKVINYLHFGFEDPANASGSINEILKVYRKVRDQIREKFLKFYLENLKVS